MVVQRKLGAPGLRAGGRAKSDICRIPRSREGLTIPSDGPRTTFGRAELHCNGRLLWLRRGNEGENMAEKARKKAAARKSAKKAAKKPHRKKSARKTSSQTARGAAPQKRGRAGSRSTKTIARKATKKAARKGRRSESEITQASFLLPTAGLNNLIEADGHIRERGERQDPRQNTRRKLRRRH